MNATAWGRLGAAILWCSCVAQSARAYELMEPPYWADGTVRLQLKLGGTPTYSDGANPNATAQNAAQLWNPNIARVQLAAVSAGNGAGGNGNGASEVFFSRTIYGYSFGDGVLAVTLVSADSAHRTETDVIVNQAESWDSYRGSAKSTAADLRRVLVHEFGHVLGLDHSYGETIMMPYIGNIEAPTADDRDAVAELYGNTPANPARPPVIQSGPWESSAIEGHSVSLHVDWAGSKPMSFQWSKDGVALPGATLDTFSIASLKMADAGDYAVVLTNAGGSVRSGTAHLTVVPLAPPRVESGSLPDVTALASRGVALFATVLNPEMGPFSYQWNKDGQPLPGQTQEILSFASAQVSDSGLYSVTIGNAAGSATSRGGRLTVNPILPPHVTDGSPADQQVVQGENAVLQVTLSNPEMWPFTIQWFKDGAPVSGDFRLTLYETKPSDTGDYSAVVTNSAGSATTRMAHLTVLPPIALAVNIVAMTDDLAIGGSLLLTTSLVQGSQPVSYQWEKDGLPLAGQNSPVLNRYPVTTDDNGTYTVVATNAAGSARSDAIVIHAQPRPAPTLQGLGYYDSVNKIGRFGVSPKLDPNSGPYTFQWYRNGQPVPGAYDQDYDLSSPTQAQAGEYFLVAKGAAGTFVSTAVDFTLDLLPGETKPGWVAAARSGSVVYVLFDHPARLERYDLSTAAWLEPILFSRTPTAFSADSSGLFVAFGAAISRFNLDGTGETPLATAAGDVRSLAARNGSLYVDASDDSFPRLVSIATTDGRLQSSYSNGAAYTTFGHNLSVANDLGLLFGSDTYWIREVLLTAGGAFGDTLETYLGFASDQPPRTFVLPDEDHLADTTGSLHEIPDLSFVGSLGGAFDDLALTDAGNIVVLRGSSLQNFDAAFRETGTLKLPKPGARVFAMGNNLFVFNPVGSGASRPEVARVELRQLAPPIVWPRVSPVGLDYTPSDIVVDARDVVYLLDRVHGSVFRWSTSEGRYLDPLPLTGAPNFLVRLPGQAGVYVTYPDRRISHLTFDPAPAETPFISVLSDILCVCASGDRLLVAESHVPAFTLYGAEGVPTDHRSVFNSPAQVYWSPASQRVYSFLENSSSGGLTYTAVDAQGKIGEYRDIYSILPREMRHPIRFSPDGTLLLGSGVMLDPETFERAGALPFAVDDAVWLDSRLYTARSTTTGVRIERWNATTTDIDAAGELAGRVLRLFALSGHRLLAVIMNGKAPAFVTLASDLANAAQTGPVILTQPSSGAAPPASDFPLQSEILGRASAQWFRDGLALAGADQPTLLLRSLQPPDAGLYTASIAGLGNSTVTNPAIVGLDSTAKFAGIAAEVGADVRHPNGNIYDQILPAGNAVAVTADAGQVTRTSYLDSNGDIVQVEFAGAGTLSLVLGNFSGPATPANYHQPEIAYMTGDAGIVITGADETTNVSVFTVGRATAFDPTGAFDITKPIGPANDPAKNGSPLFQDHATTKYDGVADLRYIAILTRNGQFGGIRASNARFGADAGYAGIYAPAVQFAGPVYVGDIDARGSARPVLIVGSVTDARVAGGDMNQTNRAPVETSGLTRLRYTDGSSSDGTLLSAQRNQARFEERGVDVTARIVVNPSP